MLRAWLVVSAVLTFGFGLFALLAPSAMGSLYGNPAAPDAALWGRYYGSAVVALGGVTAFVLASRDPRLERMLGALLAAFYGVNLGISLGAQAGGVVNGLGWTNVALQAAMCVGLATLALANRRAALRGSGRAGPSTGGR